MPAEPADDESDEGFADPSPAAEQVSATDSHPLAAQAGGGELDEATRAEIEGIQEPEQTESKKS